MSCILKELKVRETSRIAQNIIDSPEATMGPNPTPFSFLEVEKRLKGHEMVGLCQQYAHHETVEIVHIGQNNSIEFIKYFQ